MFEGYYAERVLRDRERETGRILLLRSMERTAGPGPERAVLSADWSGWNWRQARSVLGTVVLALGVSVGLPSSIQGLAWILGQILELLSR